MTTETAPQEGDLLESMPTVATPAASTALAATDANPYLPMIDRFLAGGGDIEKLDKLLDLKAKWDAQEAVKEFNAAVAAFKANPPQVYKDKKNQQYNSTYTSIGNMVNTVNAALGPHGLSADWDINQDDPKLIKVSCTLAHAKGHSKTVEMSGPPDETGQKNALQKIKSTVTYLKLATFEAVTGIASQEANLDDDGNAASAENTEENMAKVADFEVAILEAIDEVALGHAGKDIATCGLPPKLRTRLRKAYGNRLNELRKAAKA